MLTDLSSRIWHDEEPFLKLVENPQFRHLPRKSPSLILETDLDRKSALRQIGGCGARWLNPEQLSNLFSRMQDGFSQQGMTRFILQG